VLIPLGVPHVYAADPAGPLVNPLAPFPRRRRPILSPPVARGRLPRAIIARCLRGLEIVFHWPTPFWPGRTTSRTSSISRNSHTTFWGYVLPQCRLLPPPNGSGSHDIQATVVYIAEHLRRTLTGAMMARHAGLSVSHFSLLFQRKTGLPPLQFLSISASAGHASSWTPHRSPYARICRQVGSTTRYFARLFSQTMGLSPRSTARRARLIEQSFRARFAEGPAVARPIAEERRERRAGLELQARAVGAVELVEPPGRTPWGATRAPGRTARPSFAERERGLSGTEARGVDDSQPHAVQLTAAWGATAAT
jgi:AraC-like DNA-binding protein